MKKFLTTVVLMTSLLVFGCAEDSGVNPLETEISTQMNKSFIDFTTGMSVEGKGGQRGNNGNGNNGKPGQDGYSNYGVVLSEEVTVNGTAGRKIRFSSNTSDSTRTRPEAHHARSSGLPFSQDVLLPPGH